MIDGQSAKRNKTEQSCGAEETKQNVSGYHMFDRKIFVRWGEPLLAKIVRIQGNLLSVSIVADNHPLTVKMPFQATKNPISKEYIILIKKSTLGDIHRSERFQVQFFGSQKIPKC